MLNNYRMAAYALIAAGFLNWDYQRSAPHAALHSFAIIIPGAALLAATFISRLRPALARRGVQALIVVVEVAALAYAFIN